MAGDLTQIMMDAEAEANQDIASRDMQHTISSGTSGDALIRRATGDPTDSSGSQVHDELMRRAEQQHLMDSLGQGSQFFDYKNSSVGGIGNNREVRRELTLRSRQERKKREERFGKTKRPVPARKRSDGENKRQAFNAESPQPRNYFHEPPSRNYNPYA